MKALLKPHWPRPRLVFFRPIGVPWLSFSFSLRAEAWPPLLEVGVGRIYFCATFGHAPDCGCDNCIPF